VQNGGDASSHKRLERQGKHSGLSCTHPLQ
jgi:hypothetical protein